MLYFLPVDKHQRFLQIDTIFLGVCGLLKITSLLFQYLKKEFSDEVDLSNAYKHEGLIHMILMGMSKHRSSFQNSIIAMSLQYLKKEVRDGVDSLHADKH